MTVDTILERLDAGAEVSVDERAAPELRTDQRRILSELRRAAIGFALYELDGRITLKAWRMPPWGAPRTAPADEALGAPEPVGRGRFKRRDRQAGGIRRRDW